MNSVDLSLLSALKTAAAAQADSAAQSDSAAASMEAVLTRYLAALRHPSAQQLAAECVHRAQLMCRLDPSLDPGRTALAELHRTLGDHGGAAHPAPASPADASLGWRLGHWAPQDGTPISAQAAPPIRLEHMVPELFYRRRP